MFIIKVSNRFFKDAKSAPREIRTKIPALLDHLENNPVPVDHYDVKKIKGERNLYRIRFGDYRAVYSVDFVQKEIIMLKIGKRKNVYGR